ncbi:MAG: hypothetical protein WCR54_01940 [Clostridia bacterium]
MTKAKKRNIFIIVIILILIIVISTVVVYLNSETYFNKNLGKPSTYLEVKFDTLPQNQSHGSLYRTDDGLLVLDMNGTEAEMGYSHGYLLGNQIKYTVEYALTISESLSVYNDMHDNVLPKYLLMNEFCYCNEIQAIMQGAIDSGANLYVESLKRNWDIMDLWMINTVQDWYQLACSGIGVWGEASTNGKTFIGRNLDFFLDRHGYVTQLYTIMIFRGNSTQGDDFRNDIVSFSFPGIISVISGFNSKGVWMHVDSSNGDMTGKIERTGICLSIRRFLEKEDGVDIDTRSQEFFLQQNIANSVLVMVGSNNKLLESPVFVLEVRDSVVGYRGETNKEDDFVIMTNHERVNQEKVEGTRYPTLIKDFNEYKTTDDLKIDADELLLSQSHCGHCGTINAIQFYPEDLSFRVGYSKVNTISYGKKWSHNDIELSFEDAYNRDWITWDNLKNHIN